MHEYPLLFYFVFFLVVIFFYPNLSFVFFILFFFLSGLYMDKFLGLFLRRYENPYYDKVFVLPFKSINAYTIGNSILMNRGTLEQEEKVLLSILFHEIGHIRSRDFTTLFLLIGFFKFLVVFTQGKALVLYFLYVFLFAWFYWSMETKADLYAFAKLGEDYKETLRKFGIRWRLYFLEGKTDGSLQQKAMFLLIIFLMGLYLGWLYKKSP